MPAGPRSSRQFKSLQAAPPPPPGRGVQLADACGVRPLCIFRALRREPGPVVATPARQLTPAPRRAPWKTTLPCAKLLVLDSAPGPRHRR
jgi:hypothetical protein